VPLNKPSGNMYPWAWTWNPYGGLCLYACKYCYVRNKIGPWLKRMGILKYVGKPRLIEHELKTPLIKPKDGKVIFVCSNNDLFGDWVPSKDIVRILLHCCEYDNEYLFQSKNPGRFNDFIEYFPERSILGTTLETNRFNKFSKAPAIYSRYRWMADLDYPRKMVSIEPIMDFDVDILTMMIRKIKPEFVSIGADSGKNNLPEPNPEKVRSLINELEKFTEVRVKKNLNRLFGGDVRV